MATHFLDLEANRANQWFLNRAELQAWLNAIFDEPFGHITPGRNASRTDEGKLAWELVYRVKAEAPAITIDTDHVEWARARMHEACMSGLLDAPAPAGRAPLVLRLFVAGLKSTARIDVEDLQGLERERREDERAAAAGAYTTLRPGIDYAAFSRYLELVHVAGAGAPLAMAPAAIMELEDKGAIVDLDTGAVTWPEDGAQ